MAVKKKYNNKSKKKNIKINKEIILEKNLINNNDNIDNSNEVEFTNIDKPDDINNLNNIDNDTDNSLDKTIIIEPLIIKNKNKNNYLGISLVLGIIFILGVVILFSPRIKIYGEEEMIITYKDKYIEPGYEAYVLNKNVSNDIKIESNLSEGIVGNYQIVYYINKMGIKFKKRRNIIVVDEDKPKIEVDNSILELCPNEEAPNISYQTIDEYDGNLTNKTDVSVLEDHILFRVKDSSLNETLLTIPITRIDKEAPIIKLKGESTMYLNEFDKYIEPGYTVSDNCSTNLDNKVEVEGTVSHAPGIYTLTYSVRDESGNEGTAIRKVIVVNNVKDSGVINNGVIYLTFDDGPNDGTTNKILDILKDEGVKATFFVTCNGPDSLIKRMSDEGHTVALHTASHNYSYIYSSTDNYFNDLNKVSNRVKRITGKDSKIIRFPGGSSNTVSKNYQKGIMTELSNLVLNKGYRYFDWNVDAMDASSAKNSGDVYYNVISNLSINQSNVVLMHDTKNITVMALRNIIRYGKENGYQFMGIDMNTYMVRHNINN